MSDGGSTPIDEPPVDPEDWSDDQWLEWLTATDAANAEPQESAPATPIGRVTSTAGGHVLGQAMIGLHNAIYGTRDDEMVVVVEGVEPTDDDAPFSVHLDRDHPERSSIVFRRGDDHGSPDHADRKRSDPDRPSNDQD